MEFKWGDTVMVLSQRVFGEYCDVQGQFRGIALRGAFKGKALVSLLGVNKNFHVELERLWDVNDYMRRYNALKDKGSAFLLPPGACGRLIHQDSESTKGHLLENLIDVKKENK